VEGGRGREEGELGAPVGTTIEVRDLLANQPARLKFLRGEATEASHVTEVLTRLAMAHEGVHIRLKQSGRMALDAPPAPTVLERARQLLGARLAGRLHEVRGEESGVRVVALLAAPELAQTTAGGARGAIAGSCTRSRWATASWCRAGATRSRSCSSTRRPARSMSTCTRRSSRSGSRTPRR